MGLTSLIVSSVVLIYISHNSFTEGYCAPCTCPCEKENVTAKYIKDHADVIERVKQNVLSGKKEIKKETKAMDCAEVLQSGHVKSGVYTIWPKYSNIGGNATVYCDMDTDGGGWTVIQRRGDYGQPKDYFYRDWRSYKMGFGDIKEDFWLGNDLIFVISNQTSYSIRFDLSDFQGDRAYALYDNFWIEDEDAEYRMHIGGYSGNAGDDLTTFDDHMKFTTKDRDNDLHPTNCAEKYKGAWWYNSCSQSNINGLYLKGKISDAGIVWYSWKSDKSLSTTEIKIRPKSFHKL